MWEIKKITNKKFNKRWLKYQKTMIFNKTDKILKKDERHNGKLSTKIWSTIPTLPLMFILVTHHNIRALFGRFCIVLYCNVMNSIIGVYRSLMVSNATFNNIAVILWQSVLLVEETRDPRENYRHWQTFSHKFVLSTPRHQWDSNSQF